MYLERVRQPADLRDLSYDELRDLAGEIRDFVVSAVSDTGGHLGSNLGAVELTLAMHRVFDSPTDAILWDTGHQAYIHKIVTGRQKQFEQLRQQGGLSGYPSREESEHDYIENSHASTVLSYAYGMAVARDLGTDPHRHIVAVIGDGSLTGGMAYEALNNIGHGDKQVIIVLNDNGRSYAPTVSMLSASAQGRDERAQHPANQSANQPRVTHRVTGKLAHALTDIRTNPVYVRRQRRLEEFLQHLPVVGNQAGSAMDAFKAGVREFLQPPSFFEALGVRYVGPFDGHNIEQMEHAFQNAIELSAEGPILVHVLTQKGRGYSPAEDDDEKNLHDAPVFDPLVGPPKAMSTGYTQAFAEAILKEAEADDLPRVKLETSKGPIVVELFENEAPNTVANFVSLVEKGFYDGLTFHRVLPHFVAQGGDPKGDGSGGPGYSIACEWPNDPNRMHFRGVLSMAHAGRDTGGSQFFLTMLPTPHLNDLHTVFGRVIEGAELLSELQRVDPQNPTAGKEPDRIVKATVVRKRDHAYEPKTLPER